MDHKFALLVVLLQYWTTSRFSSIAVSAQLPLPFPSSSSSYSSGYRPAPESPNSPTTYARDQFLQYIKPTAYPVTISSPPYGTPTLYNTNEIGTSPIAAGVGRPACSGQLIGDEYKYVCSGPTPTLTRKYILWLQAGRARPISIEVPNYKLDDWIEAGFKRDAKQRGRSRINVYVKQPEVSAHATAEETAPQEPEVNLEYEPVLKMVRHFGANEVRIVGPGVIQEPNQFGGGGASRGDGGYDQGGRQQFQYKRDVNSLNADSRPPPKQAEYQGPPPVAQPVASLAPQVEMAARPMNMNMNMQHQHHLGPPVTAGQPQGAPRRPTTPIKAMPLPPNEWHPISGPGGHRIMING